MANIDSLKYASDIQESVSHVMIFRERSERLVARLLELLKNLPKSMAKVSEIDLHAKSSISLISVTVDDLIEYFKLISLKSPELIAHLLKYGSDEECFCKWNERLRLICNSLNMPNMSTLFDAKIDQDDLCRDVKHLIDVLPSITSSIQKQTKIKNVLDIQKTSAYKTINNFENGVIIKASKIKYDSLLGKGAFGEVWKARIKSEFVAVKKIPKNLLDEESKAKLKIEAEVMKSLSHPGIVACIGLVDEEKDVGLVMELCSAGSLDNLIKTRIDLGLKFRVDLALYIANAMSYLHRLNVIHRDLKPGNVVLDVNMRPKITDFGLAFTQSATMTSFRGSEMGTPAFMAPECFGLTPIFSAKSDVYAFSIIMWELYHMKQAYLGVNALEIRDSIREGQRLSIEPSIPEHLGNLIQLTWEHNARARPPFTEIVRQLRGYIALISPAAPITNETDTVPLIKATANDSQLNQIKKFGKPTRKNRTGNNKKRIILFGACIFFIILSITGLILALFVFRNTSGKSSDSTPITSWSSPTRTTTTTSRSVQTVTPINSSSIIKVSTLVNDSNLLSGIWGIIIDDNDNIYIATSTAYRGLILKIDIDNGDLGICYYNGYLYLPRIGQITRIDLANGKKVSRFAGTGVSDKNRLDGVGNNATFYNAVSCLVDESGNILVVDSILQGDTGQSYIRKINQNGLVTTIFKANIRILSLAFDKSGNLLFVDFDHGTIGIVTSDSTFTPIEKFLKPSAVTSDSLGNLFVADTLNHCLYWLNSQIVQRSLAGGKGIPGFTDGFGSAARFDPPRMLALDSKGRLFLADESNNVIRVITW